MQIRNSKIRAVLRTVELLFTFLADSAELFESRNQIPPVLYYFQNINILPESS
jgi:hypothetical protein